MKAAVVTFPGSNNDDDCRYTLSQILDWQVDSLWHKDTPDLSQYTLVLLPGGFSYGDYLRSGAIAKVSPIMKEVVRYANSGGLTIGICNGFQILCESGLLPGALARNSGLKFICKDIHVKVCTNQTPWTDGDKPGQVMQLPIAHGEGRYVADEDRIKELKQNDQIVLRYCDAEGKIGDNPNGSSFDIAGICNKKGNVFGLMPHPERATHLRSKQGQFIWNSLVKSIKEAHGAH